jgi:hypothetical protein
MLISKFSKLEKSCISIPSLLIAFLKIGYSQPINPFEFVGKAHNLVLEGFETNLDEAEAVNLIVSNFNDDGKAIPDSFAKFLYNYSFSNYPEYEHGRRTMYSELSLTSRQIAYFDLLFNLPETNIGINEYLRYINATVQALHMDKKLSTNEKNIIFATLSVAKYSALFWIHRKTEDETMFSKNDLFAFNDVGLQSIVNEFHVAESGEFSPYVDTTKRQKRITQRVQRQTQRWIKKSAKDTLWSTDSLKVPTHKWIKADAYGVLAGTLFGLGSWAALQYLLESKDNANALSYSVGAALFLAIPPINSAIYVLRYKKGKTREQRINQYENWNAKP